jgi:hypothetical protein
MERRVDRSRQEPNWRSYLAVLCLLGEALLEGLKLPFRLTAFLMKRRAISEDLRKTLGRDRPA